MTRFVGVLALVILVSGTVMADVVVACHEAGACHHAVEATVGDCEVSSPVVSPCCLDREQSGEIAEDVSVRAPRTSSQNECLVEIEPVVAERAPDLRAALDADASGVLATPSPPLFRLHAALLL